MVGRRGESVSPPLRRFDLCVFGIFCICLCGWVGMFEGYIGKGAVYILNSISYVAQVLNPLIIR